MQFCICCKIARDQAIAVDVSVVRMLLAPAVLALSATGRGGCPSGSTRLSPRIEPEPQSL
jgi:hypothetical protein